MKITRKFPMENILWYPGGSYKENKMVNSVCEVVQHTLPAHICDFFLWMVGRKQFMVRLVQGGLRNNVCVDDAKKLKSHSVIIITFFLLLKPPYIVQ